MPELPEAETIARELNSALTGAMVAGVRVLRRDVIHGDPRPLARLIRGRRVVRAYRRAKRVIVEFDPAADLVFHLGMSGRLTVESKTAELLPHTHLRVQVGDGSRELRFRDPRRFGGVWCLAGHKRHVGRRLGALGPEPLDLKPRVFIAMLDRKRQIKALLLDQHVVVGIGNIYCDEALHLAAVHPLTPACDLTESSSRRLLRSIKTTLRKAIEFRGTTLVDYRRVDGSEGSFRQHHRVYHREGKPCRRCRTPIERLIVAGRSTFVCPVCQAQ